LLLFVIIISYCEAAMIRVLHKFLDDFQSIVT